MSDDAHTLQPAPSDLLTVPFWEAAERGEFKLPKCEACQRFHFYPRSLCPHCGSARLSWCDAEPEGTILAATTVHRAPAPDFAADVPYSLAVVVLTDGPSLFGRLQTDRAIGETVRIGFAKRPDALPLVVFRLPD